jgi:hypothetical protein
MPTTAGNVHLAVMEICTGGTQSSTSVADDGGDSRWPMSSGNPMSIYRRKSWRKLSEWIITVANWTGKPTSFLWPNSCGHACSGTLQLRGDRRLGRDVE